MLLLLLMMKMTMDDCSLYTHAIHLSLHRTICKLDKVLSVATPPHTCADGDRGRRRWGWAGWAAGAKIWSGPATMSSAPVAAGMADEERPPAQNAVTWRSSLFPGCGGGHVFKLQNWGGEEQERRERERERGREETRVVVMLAGMASGGQERKWACWFARGGGEAAERPLKQ